MAHARHEFALIGYSEDLEWRPLKFVDPIPASRICISCGIIPRLTYTLVCGHTFCESCYGSCATTSECVCPLDGDACDRDDVTSKKYPAEQLLSRKVHCWNEANGCSVVLPASQIAHHVRHDCQHHVTRCPTCLATVLNRDVCAHLKSRCTSLALHAAPPAPEETDDRVNTQFVAFEREVKQRVVELDTKLAQLSIESASQSDKLVDVSHNINHLKEALTDQLRTASVQTLERLDRNEAEMRALVAYERTIEHRVGELDTKLAQLSLESGCHSDKLIEIFRNNIPLQEALAELFRPALDRNLAEIEALYSEKSESVRTAVTPVLTSVPSDAKTHQRVLKGYAALKEKTLNEGFCLSMSDKVYLQRYLMSWGIFLKKDGTRVYLSLCIQLHEGREDDFLEWPFTKELKLSIIHPETRQELHRVGTPDSSEVHKRYFCRPIDGSNAAARFVATEVESGVLERDDYVKKGQLLLRLEVLM